MISVKNILLKRDKVKKNKIRASKAYSNSWM